MGKDFAVTITDPDRAEEWRRVFGTTTVNVTGPLPKKVNLPGHPNALAFFLDLDLLTNQQHDALIEHLGTKFHMTENEVRAEIARDRVHAVPILDKDCTVSIANPQRWF